MQQRFEDNTRHLCNQKSNTNDPEKKKKKKKNQFFLRVVSGRRDGNSGLNAMKIAINDVQC
jgi:hypothetical protein